MTHYEKAIKDAWGVVDDIAFTLRWTSKHEDFAMASYKARQLAETMDALGKMIKAEASEGKGKTR